MVWISDKQRLAMTLVNKIVDKFGVDRWFVKSELPGITELSMNALVSKGYLREQEFGSTLYYRRIKELET
jgi:hypothetical protein